MSEARQHPILFNAPMVRAILEGRKTMTRRVLRVQPTDSKRFARNNWLITDDEGIDLYAHGISLDGVLKSPFGNISDRLWVRETWRLFNADEECCGGEPEYCNCYSHDGRPMYRADGNYDPDLKWKPSIFMPRNLSRILLEITNVKVERLQDISEEDAKKEGVTIPPPHNTIYDMYNGIYRDYFSELWESINGADSWAANPFVWCIEFRRVE